MDLHLFSLHVLSDVCLCVFGLLSLQTLCLSFVNLVLLCWCPVSNRRGALLSEFWHEALWKVQRILGAKVQSEQWRSQS